MVYTVTIKKNIISSSGIVSKLLGHLILTTYKNKQNINQEFSNYH